MNFYMSLGIIFFGINLILLGCIQPPIESISYYELVKEDPLCSNNECSSEYIVFSNGLVFEKLNKSTNLKAGKTFIGTAPQDKVQEVMDFVKNNIPNSFEEGCDNCQVYHVFYHNGIQTKVYSNSIEKSVKEVKELETKTQELIKSAEAKEKLLFKIVFLRKTLPYKDLHLFGDGTALLEDFGEKNGELLAAKIYSIDGTKVKKFETLLTEKFFSEKDSFNGCVEKGFNYGYVEALKGDKYNLVQTCGNGENDADKLFNELIKEVR